MRQGPALGAEAVDCGAMCMPGGCEGMKQPATQVADGFPAKAWWERCRASWTLQYPRAPQCRLASSLPIAHPRAPFAHPALRAGLAEKVQGLVDDAVSKGAKVLAGGKLPTHLPGQFYPPTVLTNINKSMLIWEEEVFGPVRARVGVSGCVRRKRVWAWGVPFDAPVVTTSETPSA